MLDGVVVLFGAISDWKAVSLIYSPESSGSLPGLLVSLFSDMLAACVNSLILTTLETSGDCPNAATDNSFHLHFCVDGGVDHQLARRAPEMPFLRGRFLFYLQVVWIKVVAWSIRLAP
jgi:hypothetical protein